MKLFNFLHLLLFIFLITLPGVHVACLPTGDESTPETGYSPLMPDNGEEDSETEEEFGVDEELPPSPILPVPVEIQGLLDSICSGRPEPTVQKAVFVDEQTGEATDEEIIREVLGEGIIEENQYMEVLVEEDQGDLISNVNLLVSQNGGTLYVEPSRGGHLYWGARKWILTETTEIGKERMSDIELASYGEAYEGEGRGRLLVSSRPEDSPKLVLIDKTGSVIDTSPGVRYQEVCLVIKAPPHWALDLIATDGPLESYDHEGPLQVSNFNGNITIIKRGDGAVEATNDNGKVDLIQKGNGDIAVEGSNGTISIIQRGSGKVIAYNANETLSVTASPNTPLELMTEYGAINYFVQGGTVSRITDSWITSDSAAINVHLDPGIGFNLDAQTEVGSISLPSGFPQPEKVGLTGEKVIGGIRGGGGPLFIRSYAGSICLEDVEEGGLFNDCAH